jgi:TRAP-type C4-dicarboxylate transport system permease large subunit
MTSLARCEQPHSQYEATQLAILSPPVALALVIVCPIAGCSIAKATVEILPYAACILLVTLRWSSSPTLPTGFRGSPATDSP